MPSTQGYDHARKVGPQICPSNPALKSIRWKNYHRCSEKIWPSLHIALAVSSQDVSIPNIYIKIGVLFYSDFESKSEEKIIFFIELFISLIVIS